MTEDSGSFLLVIRRSAFLKRVTSDQASGFIYVINSGSCLISICVPRRFNQWGFFVSWLRQSLNKQILVIRVHNLLYF